MKRENTAKRLKTIMEAKGLRQIDILNLTKPYCKEFNVKMNRSDISQYVSGKVEPNQSKLAILGMALDVNEAWLMGFDVPMMRKNPVVAATDDFNLIDKYSKLSVDQQRIVMSLIDSLLNL